MNSKQKNREVNKIEIKIVESGSKEPIILEANYFGSLHTLTMKRDDLNFNFNIEGKFEGECI